MLKIAKLNNKPEIFHSIQGEGKNIGRPSVFIRTSLCNLQCIWCDTDYTWNWDKFNPHDEMIEISAEEVADAVKEYNSKNIVITGGEPLLQQRQLRKVMELLMHNSRDYFFEVETNGTILPTRCFDTLIHQYNVSPKLAHSNNTRMLREKSRVYDFFRQSEKAYFKFVIIRESDLDEVLRLVETYKLHSDRVFLMPEGTRKKELDEKRLWIIDAGKRYGFCFTDRLHIELYGSKRGV